MQRVDSKTRLRAASYRTPAFFALFSLISLVIVASFRSAVLSSSTMPSEQSMIPIFSLLVTLQFADASSKARFFDDISPVAEHCRLHEPDTLSYQIMESDKDPLQVMVVERYRDKDHAYLQIHKSSAPFLTFRAKLQAMQTDKKVTVSGHSYLDHASIGYAQR